VVSQQDATLPFSWVENRPLDGRHTDIGKVESSDSPNYTRLISGIRGVYNQVTGAASTTAPGLQPNFPTQLDDIYTDSSEDGNPTTSLPGLRVLALGMQCLLAFSVLVMCFANSNDRRWRHTRTIRHNSLAKNHGGSS
jgi:hypothetical protein